MRRLRFKQFLRERNEFSPNGEEPLLSVSEYFGVKPRSEAFQFEEHESRAATLEGYRIVHANDLVMNYMLAWKGAYGVSGHAGIVSPAYSVFSINESIADVRYLHHRLRSDDMKSYFRSRSKGIIESRLRLYPDSLLASWIELPDLPIQRAIADFLDRETARIDLLIEKKQCLFDMIAPRFEALIAQAREQGEWKRFGYCAIATNRPIPSDPDRSFSPLGLYNRGRGFFVKPETGFDDLGDSSFYFVKERDLVFSGQFAWEGAVGLASADEDGCVVSHRYPVYTGRNGVLSEYLFAYFRSHHGRFLMDNCSRGAAGRNRPLNTRLLEKEKIPIPAIGLQDRVKEIIDFERKLKSKITPSIERLREYRAVLITAAVTGQIDVRSWGKTGQSDRQLDAIQSEFAE